MSHDTEKISVVAKLCMLYSKNSKTGATGRTANGFGETVDVDHGHAGVVLGCTMSHKGCMAAECNTL